MSQDCVVMVKDRMAKLCREKNGLVERLNAIHDQIEEETDLLSKVLLKVEWMEEKQRCVGPLQKVSPFLTLLRPSFNREHPDAHQLTQPTSTQIVESLQRMLMASAPSAEVTPAAGKGEVCWDGSSTPRGGSSTPRGDLDIDDVGKNTTPRHPWAFSALNSEQLSVESPLFRTRRSCEEQCVVAAIEHVSTGTEVVGSSRTASLERMQTELFTLTMARIADGFVREWTAPQPPSQVFWNREIAVEKSVPIYGPAARPPNDDTATCSPTVSLDDDIETAVSSSPSSSSKSAARLLSDDNGKTAAAAASETTGRVGASPGLPSSDELRQETVSVPSSLDTTLDDSGATTASSTSSSSSCSSSSSPSSSSAACFDSDDSGETAAAPVAKTAGLVGRRSAPESKWEAGLSHLPRGRVSRALAGWAAAGVAPAATPSPTHTAPQFRTRAADSPV